MLEIKRAEALEDYWLRLVLTDGSTVERNVKDLLRGPVFERLRRDYAAFRRVRARNGTVVWVGDLDLDSDVLIWNGPSPSRADATPAASMVLTHPQASLVTPTVRQRGGEAGPIR